MEVTWNNNLTQMICDVILGCFQLEESPEHVIIQLRPTIPAVLCFRTQYLFRGFYWPEATKFSIRERLFPGTGNNINCEADFSCISNMTDK